MERNIYEAMFVVMEYVHPNEVESSIQRHALFYLHEIIQINKAKKVHDILACSVLLFLLS